MFNLIKNIALASVATLIVACGGGGSGSGGGLVASTTSVISTGDYFTYAFSSTPVTGTPTAYTFTRYMTNVKPDQSFVTDFTYSNGTAKSTYDTNSDFQELSWISGSTSCNNSPLTTQVGSVKNLKVGTTWDLKYTRTCITSNTSTVYAYTYKGSVTASEPYVIAGLTFDTYKLVYTQEYQTSTNRFSANYTCWRDKNFDRTLACEWSYANYANGSTVTTAATSGVGSYKLYAFNVANFTNNKPSVARFAGDWTLNWNGDGTGTCSITANIVGGVTGTCTQKSPYATSSITGTVDINGGLNITSGVGSTISGGLTSPISGNGTTKNGTTIGFWTASHL